MRTQLEARDKWPVVMQPGRSGTVFVSRCVGFFGAVDLPLRWLCVGCEHFAGIRTFSVCIGRLSIDQCCYGGACEGWWRAVSSRRRRASTFNFWR